MNLENALAYKLIGIEIKNRGELDRVPDKIEYELIDDSIYATGTWWGFLMEQLL